MASPRRLTPEEEAAMFEGVPETSPSLPEIPEDVRQYVSRDPFADAAAADKKAAIDRWRMGMVDAGARMMIGENAQTPQYLIPSEVQQYVLRHGMERADRQDQIEGLRAAADYTRATRENTKLDDQPAPPEWGARAGMTRGEALRAGYGKAPDNKPAPAPLTADEIADAQKMRIAYEGRDPEKVRDDVYGERRSVRAADAASAARDAAAGRQATQQGIGNENELRKEFNSHPVVKNTQAVAESYAKVSTTSDTAAGDLSLIFAYMKMLDPGSTVREGEFANAQNAGGVGDSIRNAYNRAISGERLNVDQRQKFREEGKRLLDAQLKRYEQVKKQYRDLATRKGFNPDDIVLPMDFGEAPPAPALKPGKIKVVGPGGRVGQADAQGIDDWLASHPDWRRG